jgi:hypothetical protein
MVFADGEARGNHQGRLASSAAAFVRHRRARSSRNCTCKRAVRRAASSSSPRRAASRGASTTTPTGASAGFRSTRRRAAWARLPYDLRHSFASLRIQEGRLTIVELAEQLGHSPTMTLRTYAHVIAEFRGSGQVDPDALIADARAAVPGRERVARAPKRTPQRKRPASAPALITQNFRWLSESPRPDSNRRPLPYQRGALRAHVRASDP